MNQVVLDAGTQGKAIAPFWNRVPLFFLFPLHPTLIGRVLLLSVVPALGVYATSVPATIWAIVGLGLLAWIGFLRFGSRGNSIAGRLLAT